MKDLPGHADEVCVCVCVCVYFCWKNLPHTLCLDNIMCLMYICDVC